MKQCNCTEKSLLCFFFGGGIFSFKPHDVPHFPVKGKLEDENAVSVTLTPFPVSISVI